MSCDECLTLGFGVVFLRPDDLQQDAAMGMSPCKLFVKRAAAQGGRRIQLVCPHIVGEQGQPVLLLRQLDGL